MRMSITKPTPLQSYRMHRTSESKSMTTSRSNQNIHDSRHHRHCDKGCLLRPQNILIMFGVLLIGVFVGFIIYYFILRFCSKRRRENINTNPRRRSYRTANEMVSDSFRSYIYGLTPESSIYGTQETYLTSEERTRLGMNKVMKHASAQTEGMKALPRCDCIQEGDSYDYAMTCVVYQNVNPKTRNPYGKYFYKTSTDYSNPLYGEDYDDVMYKQKTKQDTDDNNYIDPNLINAKRSRKNRSKKKTNDHSSDSESEKEYVDKEFQKFARTLRWKRATQKRPEIDMQVEKSKSVPLQAPRPRKRKTVRSRGGKKGQYMRMKLTPELWEILRQQAKLMGDFEHKPYTKRNISNESLHDDGDENDEETSSASYDDADDTDFDYVDLTFGN